MVESGRGGIQNHSGALRPAAFSYSICVAANEAIKNYFMYTASLITKKCAAEAAPKTHASNCRQTKLHKITIKQHVKSKHAFLSD